MQRFISASPTSGLTDEANFPRALRQDVLPSSCNLKHHPRATQRIHLHILDVMLLAYAWAANAGNYTGTGGLWQRSLMQLAKVVRHRIGAERSGSLPAAGACDTCQEPPIQHSQEERERERE